jgi:type III secretory pathway component EscV
VGNSTIRGKVDMNKHGSQRKIKPWTEKEKKEVYIAAVTNTQAWFDKATELLLLAEIVERRIREAWADTREKLVSNIEPPEAEEILNRIRMEAEKKNNRWPVTSQGLYFALNHEA